MENTNRSYNLSDQDVELLHSRLQRSEIAIAELNKTNEGLEKKLDIANSQAEHFAGKLKESKEKVAHLNGKAGNLAKANEQKAEALRQMKEELARKQIEIEDLRGQIRSSQDTIIELNTSPSINPLVRS